jgi:hypothetical protein
MAGSERATDPLRARRITARGESVPPQFLKKIARHIAELVATNDVPTT